MSHYIGISYEGKILFYAHNSIEKRFQNVKVCGLDYWYEEIMHRETLASNGS